MSGINIGGQVFDTEKISETVRYSSVAVGISEDGPRGDPGPTGASGPVGPTGPVGASGATGATGASGVAGPTGASGPTGPTGADGLNGLDGQDGESAYDAWIAAGNVGTIDDFVASFAAATNYYRYIQGAPQAVWHVTHPLHRYPAVTVVDSAGSVVEGDLSYVSPTELTISFTAGFSGEAYLT